MPNRLYGCIHPHDRKGATRRLPVATLTRAPKYVSLSMAMHAGEPCTPIVSVGEHVLLGQVIAEASGLGAPIHASVSGTVSAIEPRPCPGGEDVLSVVIENDFLNTPAPPLERKVDPEHLIGWEVIDLVTRAGVVGLGGGSYPTGAKLKSSIGRVDTLIINATECEPYITAEHRLMLEDGERVLGGVEFLMRALVLRQAILAVEANQIDAIDRLRSLLPPHSGIKLVALKARYPLGSEKMLVQKLTGMEVPSGKLPLDVKCAVFNVSTAAAVYDAVYLRKPMTERIVTVAGSALREPHDLRVPIGTPLEHLLEECDGLRETPDRILVGGPMMGTALTDLRGATQKSTAALLFLGRRDYPAPVKESPCIRCGRCVNACPMGLVPMYFDLYSTKGRYRELDRFHVMDCIECGGCAYVCPSHISLVQSIRTAKRELSRHAQSKLERRAAMEKRRTDEHRKEENDDSLD